MPTLQDEEVCFDGLNSISQQETGLLEKIGTGIILSKEIIRYLDDVSSIKQTAGRVYLDDTGRVKGRLYTETFTDVTCGIYAKMSADALTSGGEEGITYGTDIFALADGRAIAKNAKKEENIEVNECQIHVLNNWTVEHGQKVKYSGEVLVIYPEVTACENNAAGCSNQAKTMNASIYLLMAIGLLVILVQRPFLRKRG